MILDAEGLYMDAQTTNADPEVGDNVIDHFGGQALARDNEWGGGYPLYVFSLITTAITGGTSTSWAAELVQGTTTSPTTLIATSAGGHALTAGTSVILPVPPGVGTLRYSGFRAQFNTDAPTAGVMTAGLIANYQNNDFTA